MRPASLRRTALTWMVVQCIAFALRLVIHPQGHFTAVSPELLALGFGFGAISGLGIAIVYWGLLHAVAFLISKTFGIGQSPWALAIQAAVGILSGVFAVCWLNQLFQDDDPLLFVLFVALGLFGFVRSVSLNGPEKQAS